jgi:hypothetical protein
LEVSVAKLAHGASMSRRGQKQRRQNTELLTMTTWFFEISKLTGGFKKISG